MLEIYCVSGESCNTNYSLTVIPEKLRDVFKNVDQLKEDLRNTTGMSTASIDALLEASFPENSSQVSLLLSFWEVLLLSNAQTIKTYNLLVNAAEQVSECVTGTAWRGMALIWSRAQLSGTH